MRFALPLASLCSLRRLLAATVLALLSATAPTFAATLYVDDWNDGQTGAGTSTNPYRNLQVAIDRAASGDTIFIRKGLYVATPVEFTDPTCGNCHALEFRQEIPATYGFRIAYKSLILQGESRQETVIQTNAGYGVLFESAGTSRIENLTVTGGSRDGDGRATNGAIVSRWTTLTVRNANLTENLGISESTEVGVGGIVVREGSVLTADNLLIYDNSWDGIALYRGDPDVGNSGPRATITNVVIDLGYGTGIGATWDSQADITNARVSRYWKGVGSFGGSRVTLRNSVIFRQEAWGVLAWGASNLTAINNVVAHQGRMGMVQYSPDATVTFTNNIVYANGFNVDWPGFRAVGIWLFNSSRATVTYNDTFGNAGPNACSGGDCTPFPLINGNISADPLFNAPAADNFSIPCNSPAVNAGTSAITDPDGSRSDMGAYSGPSSPLPSPTCGRPDLEPTPFTILGNVWEEGYVITFDSGVRNAGPVGIGTFNVKWFVDGVQVGHGGHAGVPANSTVLNDNSKYSWTATRGTHFVTFAVDTSNSVLESDEGNNSIGLNIVIAPPRADLTPTAITYNSADLVAGRQILFDSGVQNLKNVPTGNFNIKWYVDNVQVGYGVHSGVPGSAIVLNGNSAYRWTATSGTHTIKFVLDVDYSVDESDEFNNSRSVTVTVP